jgi:hypothetical protein
MLNKRNGRWMVNDSFPAREKVMKSFLYVLHHISVVAPVSESFSQELISNLQKNAVTLSAYKKGNHERTYMIYYDSASGQTYMMMKDSEQAFKMHIPGYEQPAGSYYKLQPDYWRSRNIFNSKPSEIKKIIVHYPRKAEISFMIKVGDERIQLHTYPEQAVINEFSPETIKQYLYNFKEREFTEFIDSLPSEAKKSMLDSPPYATITLTERSGRTSSISLYQVPKGKGNYEYPLTKNINPDWLYGILGGTKEVVGLKYITIARILKKRTYFYR